MPVTSPPTVALREFLGATTRHIRRIEIYEADGVTRWTKDTKFRLKDGSVSVDYDRDERRALDLTLDNSDSALINAPGEFWYDKIIKVFRGVIVREKPRLPKVLVISDNENASHAVAFRRALVELGFGDVRINVLATDYSVDVAPYDIIVSLGGTDKGNLLETAYNAGKRIFVVREAAQQFFNALYNNTTWAGTTHAGVTPGTLVRTNLIRDPHTTSISTWSVAAATRTIVSGKLRLTANGTGTGPTSAYTYGSTGLSGVGARFVVTAGDKVALRVKITNNSAKSMAVRLAIAAYVWNGTTYGTAGAVTISGSWITLAPGEEQVLETIGVISGSTTGILPILYMGATSTTPAVSGDFVDTSEWALFTGSTAPDATPVPFFGGSTADDGEYVYTWTGTANTSASNASLPNESISPRPVADPRTLGWTTFPMGAVEGTFKAPAATLSDVFGVAFAPGSTTHYAMTAGANSFGGRYIAVHYPLGPKQYEAAQFRNFMLSAFNWLNPVETILNWEVQIGEFMIDRISEPHRPREIKITGRDYTKKLMLSKFPGATSFPEGLTLEQLVGTIAGAGGVTKRLLPATGVVIGREFFFDRNTTRWAAIKEVCTAYSYEVFFDATGYLVMRPFRDPSTTTPVLYIETGKEGQIASFEKSTSDNQIFNHIVAAGESSDANTIPVWAEARNEDPNSPTNILEIGDRYTEFLSAFITTTEQAQQLADSYLAIHALEEFELAFETLMLPWLEVGDIIGFADPNPAPDDPTTFLLSSLSLPLGLAAMGGVGRRVTIVS